MTSTVPLPGELSTPPNGAMFGGNAGASNGKPGSSFAELCQLLRISEYIADQSDDYRFSHLHVRTGQRVHLIGQSCDRMFVVKSGFLKTTLLDASGKEQVASFPIKGDLIGVDGLASMRYTLEAVAISDCELVVLPLTALTALGRRHDDLEAAVCGVMSRGLVRDQMLIGVRAGLNTHARMARFLLHLAERNAASGFSGSSFNLRMQRADIANYLGMAMETVSRTLTALEARGLISVDRRTICIKAPAILRTLKRLPRTQFGAGPCPKERIVVGTRSKRPAAASHIAI